MDLVTKYRTISNGHWDYLQYEVKYKNFWGTTKTRWEYVWKPYYDKIAGRGVFEANLYINSLRDGSLEKFVEKYPNIEKYFNEITPHQERLEQEARKWNENYESKKDTIKYL